MKRDDSGLLAALFVGLLVTSNVLSAKLVVVCGLTVPGGIVCYALTCLISDVIGERHGKERAKEIILYGLTAQILSTAMIQLTIALPGNGAEEAVLLDRLLAWNLWFALASIAGYVLSQTVNILLFHAIREWMTKKGKMWKWVWENASTIVSQAVDTVVYIAIAFGIGMQLHMSVLWQLAVAQMAVKAVLAIADTPIFYLLTRRQRK